MHGLCYGHSDYESIMLMSSLEKAETSSLGAFDELVGLLVELASIPSVVFYVVGIECDLNLCVGRLLCHGCVLVLLPQIPLSFILQCCLMSYSFLSLVGRLA